MSDLQLYQQVSLLPNDLKIEVEQFILRLLQKQAAEKNGSLKKREFGFAKGKIKMLPGFDEPLEEFNEYQ